MAKHRSHRTHSIAFKRQVVEDYGSDEFWRERPYEGRPIFDRWPLVVQWSDRVEVEWFRAVPPINELGVHDIAVSGIGTIAAAG